MMRILILDEFELPSTEQHLVIAIARVDQFDSLRNFIMGTDEAGSFGKLKIKTQTSGSLPDDRPPFIEELLREQANVVLPNGWIGSAVVIDEDWDIVDVAIPLRDQFIRLQWYTTA